MAPVAVPAVALGVTLKNVFEAAAALGSVIHMPDLPAVFARTKRLLRKGARFYVSESCFRTPEIQAEFDARPGTDFVRNAIFGNGRLRPLQVRDRSIATDVPVAEKADRSNDSHVPAPFAGVVTLQVAEGDPVRAGQAVATIEAMKLEAGITAPKSGTVARLAIKTVQQVEGGDLPLELRSP